MYSVARGHCRRSRAKRSFLTKLGGTTDASQEYQTLSSLAPSLLNVSQSFHTLREEGFEK